MAADRILLTAGLSVALLAGLLSGASAQACGSGTDPQCRPAKSVSAKAPQKIAAKQQARAQRKAAKARGKPRKASTASRAVMGGESSVALVARLPWWRADQPHLWRERMEREAESQVLVAADAWLVAFANTTMEATRRGRIELASTDGLTDLVQTGEQAVVADSGELNEIDLTAAKKPADEQQSWLHVVLAMLGGAVAAASTARFLFV